MMKINLSVTLSLLYFICIHAEKSDEPLSYPSLWDKVPGQLDELAKDGKIAINPWCYMHRMSLYKVLLSVTDKYMTTIGLNGTDNPLWGFPAQLGWKFRTGRLNDPTTVSLLCDHCSGGDSCISPKSWWSCVNYYVSVIPFLAAEDEGFFQQSLPIEILQPSEMAEDFCYTVSGCQSQVPELMSKWETFFQGLKNLSLSDIPDPRDEDKILELMWEAQKLSVSTAASKFAERIKQYSEPEVSFSRSWSNAVNYVAATHFRSGLRKTNHFQAPMPRRVLKEGDKPPNIADLSAEENHALYMFSWMDSMNRLIGGTLVNTWNKAMCSEKAREKGEQLLQDLVMNPQFAVSGLLSILIEMSSNC
ncbi:protein LEG1 homolog [Lepisosteus oculatus]|uniref:protein LEG1 homolog n=1 Tax=Lepisosteus oculatus TaxID=7918 RepID=UPI0035F51137